MTPKGKKGNKLFKRLLLLGGISVFGGVITVIGAICYLILGISVNTSSLNEQIISLNKQLESGTDDRYTAEMAKRDMAISAVEIKTINGRLVTLEELHK